MVGARCDCRWPRDDDIAILAGSRHCPGRLLALVRRNVDRLIPTGRLGGRRSQTRPEPRAREFVRASAWPDYNVSRPGSPGKPIHRSSRKRTELLDADRRASLAGGLTRIGHHRDRRRGRDRRGRPRQRYGGDLRREVLILYRERMPVPVSMWQPWRGWIGQGGGARAYLFANPIVELAGTRIAPLICYEQLIVWPVLQSMLHSTDIVVATGNGWWTAGTATNGRLKSFAQAIALACFHPRVTFVHQWTSSSQFQGFTQSGSTGRNSQRPPQSTVR